MPTGPLLYRHAKRPNSSLHVGLMSTYPPKICGLATFAFALERALVDHDARVSIVRVQGPSDAPTPAQVGVVTLTNGQERSIRNATASLSRNDFAIVQHEYGIYGGPDGDEVLDILAALTVPSIVVLHTVPLTPTPRQRSVLIAVAERADHLVVMTKVAQSRLLSSYGIDKAKVSLIPHGASTVAAPEGTERPEAANRLLTWGLLGPGKGIEHVIEALGRLRTLHPQPQYTVAGVTHPNVFAAHGDAYRAWLMQRAETLGVRDTVTFDGAYRDNASLARLIATATAVVLPYDSRDQVTSGVLVDAIAAGRPVIATAFPHAVEMLSSGAGILVPHGDPAAMAEAIRVVLTDDVARERMAAEARRLAPELQWSAVAACYLGLGTSLMRSARSVAI